MTALKAPTLQSEQALAHSLLSAEAVRTRAHRMLALGLDDALPHFRIDLDQMAVAADLVVATTRAAYPSLDVPLHARWRHFVVASEDRWAALAGGATFRDRAARARAELDLAIVSVLLDAGAGPDWRYRDQASGQAIGRSEGLALASLAAFAAGGFSARPDDPLRGDAAALRALSPQTPRRGFPGSDANPRPG